MCPSENQDPSAEREYVARVDLGGMAILRCTGADRISFLHRLTTGSVQGVGIGAGCHSLFWTARAT